MRRSIAQAMAFALALGAAMPALNAAAQDTTNLDTQSGTPTTWDQIEGNWTEFKGLAKERWGELTDDDLMQIQGERQQLVGRVQARYGIDLEAAEGQVTEWENSIVAP